MGVLHQGRPRGSKNLLSNDLKRDILMVYQQLGGIEGMLAWAQSSPDALEKFYLMILPRLLPKDGTLTVEGKHFVIRAPEPIEDIEKWMRLYSPEHMQMTPTPETAPTIDQD